MARKGYLLNAGEETIHSNIITLDTKEEKFKNWWYYNRKLLICILLIVLCICSIIWSIVNKTEPDYTVAVMTEYPFDYKIIEILQDHLEEYGYDRNDDGEVNVLVQNYAVGNSAYNSQFDYQSAQAAYVKFAADLSTDESMIWIYDRAGKYAMGESLEGLFKDLDYDMDLEDSTCIPWEDVPALASADFSEYKNDEITPDDVQALFAYTDVSIRKAEGSTFEDKEKVMDYYNDCVKLMDALVANEKYQGNEETNTESGEASDE